MSFGGGPKIYTSFGRKPKASRGDSPRIHIGGYAPAYEKSLPFINPSYRIRKNIKKQSTFKKVEAKNQTVRMATPEKFLGKGHEWCFVALF